GFIIPIMNICFLFCKFHFSKLYEASMSHDILKYAVVAIFFLVFNFVVATFSLKCFQLICFQYTVPVTSFFLDGRDHGYFIFLLVPITLALSLSADKMLSLKVLLVLIAEAIGSLVFCELMQLLTGLDVFSKYIISMLIVNIITPIENQYKWNLVINDQLAKVSLPVLLGSILITVIVCLYVAALQRKELLIKNLRYETDHDNLTNLLNYRAFSNYIIEISTDTSAVYTILMIDLDNFKGVNDEFGHLEGNNLLRAFTAKLSRFFSDRYSTAVKIFRFGGEEFCLVLKDVSIEDAYAKIWEFEELLTAKGYSTTTGKQVKVSFSGGVANTDQKSNIHEAIRNADAAVYLAKNNGRAQIICPDCVIE
ncbi:MAG: GGDEF domain-containing protein, partial [Liquorilactobacillus ghanensis]|uniref:GGDEF domain-containing protein n=1 Tax=Liquorilactobacillus ghanensis TaxID=399370 RepID=UPI0039EC18DE